MGDVFAAARACLDAGTVAAKLELTHAAAAAWARGGLAVPADAAPPAPIRMPGRPPRPRLVPPRGLAQRGLGTPEGKAAFLHAIAHIEFNAVDLAWDAVYRFRGLPEAYYADWIGIAADEARHFALLQARMADLGAAYGDFDAHNGLWEMAERTAASCLARMALVPRVLEARGLDVTPGMIARLRHMGDEATVAALEVILREEVPHVAAGSRWFRWCCEREGVVPDATFRQLLRDYAHGYLRGPFNVEARLEAGFDAEELAALEALAPPR
ncbi:ferritin-like domain-containing protein [Coralloluteibacterium stylophorae]|uniref:Ferritin-like domain-containing protein n=1 Tax=Coralloluteibacterium stylophorae TaxID=1776034 RepID=A0A8J7VUK9_9GAMM|nr:ferritin-like domain-containing protein [Coralloluteibacterium stylophorae]MBS7456531.1 ferritin-like domain-containing protein [Coralloluteibacterium stylophorae]